MVNICLVGVGPHAKRIYFKYFRDYGICPKLIVELKSKKEELLEYLKDNNFLNCNTIFLDDEFKDDVLINNEFAGVLKNECQRLNITHAVISTEPKAHNAYINFFLDNKIQVMSDKPITVRKGMLTKKSVKSIKSDYENIVRKTIENNTLLQIMCQRLYHEGYIYVKNLIKDTIGKYNIPVTFCEVYHCDGKWMMPHDLECENHPYKYGYGKLFHSGYHFIHLLAEIMSLNTNVKDKDKHAVSVEMTSSFISPEDELAQIKEDDYKKLFKGQKIPTYYYGSHKKYDSYGEKNNYTLFTFKNKDNKTISVAELNLLQNGFSRRGWIQTKADHYKGNGRVRHEYLNIQIGTLMNIQVHSYQSKEIKDRTSFETDIGGLEHFDIYVFRNSDIIGGKTFEKISLKDLTKNLNKNFIGYNEGAREKLLTEFLNNKTTVGDIGNHRLGIDMLYNLSKLYLKYSKNKHHNYIKFKI